MFLGDTMTTTSPASSCWSMILMRKIECYGDDERVVCCYEEQGFDDGKKEKSKERLWF